MSAVNKRLASECIEGVLEVHKWEFHVNRGQKRTYNLTSQDECELRILSGDHSLHRKNL